MWGNDARPSSRRDIGGAASSVDGESDAPVPDVSLSSSGLASLAVTTVDAEEEAAFRRRSARFDEAERSFNSLMQALTEHKNALGRVATSGVTVAERLNEFFVSSGKDAHRELAGTFLTAQQRCAGKWIAYERRYERDVVRLVKNRVDEIPGVRTGIKRRANALSEMRKLQRKTASERNNNNKNFDGPFAKVRQKRLKELESVSAEYTMHHSDVMRKFSNIERNFGNFVSPSLIALVSLLADSCKESVKQLQAVEKLVTGVQPMTKELEPVPMENTNENGETWDDDFDEPMMDTMSPTKAAIGGTYSLNLPSNTNPETITNSTSGSHTRSRSEPVAGTPQNRMATISIAHERNDHHHHQHRPVDSADTASLPDMAGSEKGGRVNANVANMGSTSSGERDGSIGGMGRERSHGSRRHRSRREGMGSSDTVPSESNSEVLMRVLVLYDFTPREVNEIELRKGEVVEVSEKTDSGWWKGRCGKQAAGFFPRNYTRELTDDEELQFLQAKKSNNNSRRHGMRNNNHNSNNNNQHGHNNNSNSNMNGLSRRGSKDSRRSAKSGSAANNSSNPSSSSHRLPNVTNNNSRSRARAL